MGLRVLIDATDVPTDRGALGRYVDGLVGALSAGGADLAIVCQRADADRLRHLAPGARVVPGPATLGHRAARLAWEQSGLPLVAQQVAADVIHMPYYSMPLHPGRPTVVTVHDVTFLTEPDRHEAASGGLTKAAIRSSAHRATRIIVPSNATRDQVVSLVQVDPGRIDVARHGVDHQVFRRPSADEVAAVRARLGLRGLPYVAYLGSLAPRKNIPALVAGWAAAVQGLPEPPALVLAGGGGWSDEVDAAIGAIPPGLKVVRPGYLASSSLRGFFGGAAVVAFPSRAEGFGLPVLEAMACGAAVLTTALSALPEVGGEAVAYTEPDAASIGSALRVLLCDPRRRADLGAAGQARAREFSWAASGAAHLASYARAAGADGHLGG